MSHTPKTLLDSIEPELLDRVTSRRDALRRTSTGVAALAISSIPLGLGVMARDAWAQGALPQGIIDVLNFALTLEYLEADFYVAGLAANNLIPQATRTAFQQISKHETAHVTLLKGVLGASAVAKPTFDFTARGAFPTVMTNYQTFLAVSQALEDTGVRAYKGQAANLISNNAILTTALQIHSVEARHASYVRRLRGLKGWITGNTTDIAGTAAVYAGEDTTMQGTVNTATYVSANAASEAFDEPLTKEAVLAIATLFIAT